MAMKRWLSWPLACLLILVLGFHAPVQGYPEPATVSPSWQLDIEYDRPRAISVENLQGQTQWYWYLPYKVINHTGEDRLFIPELTIATDTGQIIEADSKIPSSVYRAIMERRGNDLLESPVEVIGRIQQGEDFARESFAVWPHPGPEVDEMTIFFSGLSGEIQRMEHPETDEEILLRRTLMLEYRLPGKPDTPQRQPVVLEEEREVMR